MSGSASSTQTSGLSSEFAPYLQQFGSLIQNASQRPYQNYQGPRVADLSPTQNAAINSYGGLINNGGQYLGPTVDMLNNTLSGQGGNPFTDQVVSRTERPVIDAYNAATAGNTSRFNSPGNFGSDRQNLAQSRAELNLSQGLGDAVGSLYNNAYEQERQRQMQAASMMPSLMSGVGGFLGNALQAGGVQQQQLQNVYNANYGDWNNAYNYPWSQVQNISSALGPLFGAAPRTTTTTGPGPDPIQQGLGLFMLGNSLYNGMSG